MKSPRILFIVTSIDKLGETDLPSGFWLSELAIPYCTLTDFGAEATVASIKGGEAPIDPESKKDIWQTDQTRRFLADETAMKKVNTSKKIGDVEVSDYDGIYISGGTGTMWDFPRSFELKAFLEAFLKAGKPIATVCHGASALVNVTDSSGKPYIAGRTVTCFSNNEEAQLGLTGIVPFLLQTRLEELGARVSTGGNWSDTVHRDGLLVTGQNPMSAQRTAETLVELLSDLAQPAVA
ncbi:MAG: type 1 glutamine amidotransferase domain-containing protein [Pseudomonadota bacterium]